MESEILHTNQLNAIGRNLLCVNEKIARSARSVGREPESVQLVVVSKLHSTAAIMAAIQAGARKFGENYAEEAVAKINEVAAIGGIEWHMIGHIQSRKAGLVAEHFDMVQSVDSLKIAQRLNTAREGAAQQLPVLIEVNLSGEESKHGWIADDENKWCDLLPELLQVTTLSHLQVKGLMSMPPLFDDPEQTRPYFKRLIRLRNFLRSRIPGSEWTELSMGTSSDFEVAVQEGATIVRIGQAILGLRPAR
jgi:PLP dependent protein